MSTEHKKETAMDNATHSTKTPNLQEFDLAPYTGKYIILVTLDKDSKEYHELQKSENITMYYKNTPVLRFEKIQPSLLKEHEHSAGAYITGSSLQNAKQKAPYISPMIQLTPVKKKA